MNPNLKIPIVMGLIGASVAIGTAIAIANGIFTGHPHLAYWFYGAAAVLVIVAFFLAQKKPDHPSSGSQNTQSATDSFKQSQSLNNVGNPTQHQEQKQIVNIWSGPPHQQAAPATRPDPDSRISIEGCRLTLINTDPWGVWFETSRPGRIGILASVLNKAGDEGEAVGKARDLVACLDFHDLTGKALGSLSRAYWLNEEANCIDLNPGDRSEVVVADFNGTWLTIYNNQKTDGTVRIGRKRFPRVIRRPHGNGVAIIDSVLFQIKIISLDTNTTVISKKFAILRLDQDEIEVRKEEF